MRLYVFDHCPFCVRVLLAFGLKQEAVTIEYLLEDDVETPTRMIGQQMVPILEYEAGKYMPESLDIVNYLNHQGEAFLTEPQVEGIATWVNDHFSLINHYVMPRFAKMPFPEFSTDNARNVYIKRHEERVGHTFDELMASSDEYRVKVEWALSQLEKMIDLERVQNHRYSLDDILLFPLLRALTCVKDLNMPLNVLYYTKTLANQANIALYFDEAI